MSRESSANFGFRATKSVSLLTSTQNADLTACVDVARDEPFVGGALGLLRGLRRTAFEQQRLSALHVAGGIEQRLAAIHHRRARLFAQRFDLFGFGLIGNQRPASAMRRRASSSDSVRRRFVALLVVRALVLGLTLDDRVGNLSHHELDGSNSIVVAGNRVIDLVGIAVRIDHGDDRDLELARFQNRDALFFRIDDEERIGQPVHIFDSTEKALEPIHLVLQLRDLFFWKPIEVALHLHVLELAQDERCASEWSRSSSACRRANAG